MLWEIIKKLEERVDIKPKTIKYIEERIIAILTGEEE